MSKNKLKYSELPLLMFDIPKVFTDCLVVNKSGELGFSHKFMVWKGGRGSTKSQSAATILLSIMNSMQSPCKILCLRELNKTTKDSLHEMFVRLISGAKMDQFYTITNDKIVNKINKVEIVFAGAREKGEASQNKESILNAIKSTTNIRYIWFEESQYISQRALDIIIPSARSTNISLTSDYLLTLKKMGYDLDEGTEIAKDVGFLFTLNPILPEDDVIKYVKFYGEQSKILHVNITDVEDRFRNKDLLNTMEAERLSNHPHFGHKWLGEPLSDMDLGMFKHEYFKRAIYPDKCDSYFIGLDIAVSNNKKSDRTGIVVIGKKARTDYTSIDPHQEKFNYYVLEDCTGRYHPDEWGKKIDELYNKYKNPLLVVETNQGGNLITQNIRNFNKYIRIEEVKAVKNKITRAEPVSSLYALGRVFHVCDTKEIEQQLLRFSTSGYQAPDSPDNADALVWALTKAMGYSNISVCITDNVK